jgi:alpha,alpha-trehalose-phosphate synthase [UDP-forming]
VKTVDQVETDSKQLVVVSNRLPIVISRKGGGQWDIKAGSGGLVTSLEHVLREQAGTWIGWLGASGNLTGVEPALASASEGAGYQLESVPLTERQVDQYYFGFSNEVIWPLFHDMVSRCNFDPSYWSTYREVNQHFATAILEHSDPGSFVWVQDYHLMLVADYLRASGDSRNLGYFLHIPFPPLDIFVKLPWRFAVLRSLLQYDTLGFQTIRDTRNFINCVRHMMKGTRITRRADSYVIDVYGRDVTVGAFPIGIDFAGFDERARSPEVEEATRSLREKMPDRQLILGIDRLDYTKGIPERLHAFRDVLSRYPEMIGNVSLIQVVIPSREDVPEYKTMKENVERLVSSINGEFTRPGWVPVHYMFRSLSAVELSAYYRASDISLVTPLKDGMNLIAKEYCASNVDENGVLILSEFAGSASQLRRGALLVNPHDVIGTADAIYRAYVMPETERRTRIRQLRRIVDRSDVFWWTESFLNLAMNREYRVTPTQDYYVPSADVQDNAPSSDLVLEDRSVNGSRRQIQ